MIGIVLVTHGRLADEFRNAVQHVVGQQERLERFRSKPMTIWSSAATTSSMPLPEPTAGQA
jgi:mannose/fructose-specific phosphotransferase system component IIA